MRDNVTIMKKSLDRLNKSRKPATTILYLNNGVEVRVQGELHAKYNNCCVCNNCYKFHPDTLEENCPIANILHGVSLVLPTFLCDVKYKEPVHPGTVSEPCEVSPGNIITVPIA